MRTKTESFRTVWIFLSRKDTSPTPSLPSLSFTFSISQNMQKCLEKTLARDTTPSSSPRRRQKLHAPRSLLHMRRLVRGKQKPSKPTRTSSLRFPQSQNPQSPRRCGRALAAGGSGFGGGRAVASLRASSHVPRAGTRGAGTRDTRRDHRVTSQVT